MSQQELGERPRRPLPLHGVLVVSVEQAVAAPFASRQLADMGARVIKVERPDGGDFARDYDHAVNGLSSYFFWLNRGKESIALNLKDPEDHALAMSLIDRADVFVQNLAPGAAERLGISGRQVHERNDRIITCDVSGYGEGGPYEHRKAYDLLIQCEAGLVSITGSPEAPARAGISVADIAAGVYAYSGVLTALYERERTGRGTHLQVSLFDALAEWMSMPTYFGHYQGQDPVRSGAAHATIAPYGPFPTIDGSHVNIGVQNARDWAALCHDVLRSPALADDTRFRTNAERVFHRIEIEALISELLGARELSEVVEALLAAELAFGIMRGAGELIDHPQITSRSRLRTVASPVGDLTAMLPPVIWCDREPAMNGVPALGEHNDSVRAWVDASASST
jgi:itaconate CoA-transferase